MTPSARIIFTSLFCFAITQLTVAQLTDAGGIGSIGLSKDFGRYWDAKIEQEVRFNQSYRAFNRSLTTVAVDYSILAKYLKAGLDLDLVYLELKSKNEFRYRASLALATQLKLSKFDFNFRTRTQAYWRNEKLGNYTYNPKYVWRNKLECMYNIFGSPIKPSASVELFCPINGAKGFYMDSYRLKLAVKYRYSAHQSIEAFLRFDSEIQQVSPNKELYTGVAWNYKL